MSKGLIFNIEEFAVHDGPGIRKLVFFKGCPLRCTWCHNPEGLSFKKELMVSHASCIKCGRCTEICKNEECLACGSCVDVCPLNLRKICGQEFEAEELAKKLLKGKEVLINSGGGITISGGEPLAQPDFLFDLIAHLKPVHVAVETSGHAGKEIFRRMVAEADMVLMDVKHTDPDIHREYTGVGNSLILENLRYLTGADKPFYIRIPLIPGVNDTRENMEATANLVRNAPHLIRVDLLPYHKTAPAKYAMVGRNFNPEFDTNREVHLWKSVFSNKNINVNVL